MTLEKEFHVPVTVSISTYCWSQLFVPGLCGCLQEHGSEAAQGRSVGLAHPCSGHPECSELPAPFTLHFLSFSEGQLPLLSALVVLWNCKGCWVLWFRQGTWSCPFQAAWERVWSFPFMYTQTYPMPPATQTPASACLGASKAQASTWSQLYAQNTMLFCLTSLLLKMAAHMDGV